MNVNKKIEELEKIVHDFVHSLINAKDFVDMYEKLYEKLFLKKEKKPSTIIEENVFSIFDDIHAEVNYYEPNKKYRKEHSSYFDEKKLRKNVTKLYKKLKSLLK